MRVKRERLVVMALVVAALLLILGVCDLSLQDAIRNNLWVYWMGTDMDLAVREIWTRDIWTK